MKRYFTHNLLEWHHLHNKRIMPWKGEKDAYKIWISEIILQQTRVDQGISYYEKFITKFPTINSLAFAEEQEVFKMWEGLGYYTRCKNLLFTARHIINNLCGEFPHTYDGIVALKGVGPYTAAAIASFAYNLPYAVVDGNVFRVLSRYFGVLEPIDTTIGKKLFAKLAQEVLDKKEPGIYNQAIMDFGATVCTPHVPDCQACVLNKKCSAFKNGWVNKLPIKDKQLVKKNRWFNYFLFNANGKVLVQKREEKDIWQNLFEFYLVESDKALQWKDKEIEQLLVEQLGIKEFVVTDRSKVLKQQLTHQNLVGQFFVVSIPTVPKALQHLQATSPEDLSNLAFPKMINTFLDQYLMKQQQE